MKSMLAATRLALVLALAGTSFACRTARAAGEDVRDAASTVGDAAEAVFTDQGAEVVIGSSIADVDRRTRAVLRGMGMTLGEMDYDDNATEREYEGRSGDTVVHVELESRGASSTEIEVSYRTGQVNYDKERARDIIRRVQAQR